MTRNAFDQILNELGIFGFDTISKAVLTALVTGDPILLVGDHGIGKTLLAERLAHGLGMKAHGSDKEFQAYDASKTLFEDVIGFPDPHKMQQGIVAYLNSPITIWNKQFILIDEISRANPAMQNKWLEVIRSRRVMGEEIPGLKYIFAAMNPLTYLGANPLDEALADRFSQIVFLSGQFSDQDLKKILNTTHHNDAPELLKNTSNNEAFRGISRLRDMLNKISYYYYQLDQDFHQQVEKFVISYCHQIQNLKLFISPRRAAMMKRNILVYSAIDQYFDKKIKLTVRNCAQAAEFGWTYSVTEEDSHADILTQAIQQALNDCGFKRVDQQKADNTNTIISDLLSSIKDNQAGKSQPSSKSSGKSSSSTKQPYEESFGGLVKEGFEIFTSGLYEMGIKNNNDWKSTAEKQRLGIED